MSGQAVLAVPVPELDEFVRARTAHYDPAYVANDPGFVHAHITVLAPWLPAPTPEDLATVALLAAGREPFDYELAEVRAFPNGIVYLAPSPAGPFSALTSALAVAFPQCPPYDGQFREVVPHLTLDLTAPGIDTVSVRTMLGDVVPLATRAERIDLQWWAAGDCRLLNTWELG